MGCLNYGKTKTKNTAVGFIDFFLKNKMEESIDSLVY